MRVQVKLYAGNSEMGESQPPQGFDIQSQSADTIVHIVTQQLRAATLPRKDEL